MKAAAAQPNVRLAKTGLLANQSETLCFGNAGAADGDTSPAAVLAIWTQAQSVLSPGSAAPFIVSGDPVKWYEVSCDVADVLHHHQAAAALSEGDKSAWHERMVLRAGRGQPLMGAELVISVRNAGAADEPLSLVALDRFLQHLFLAFNIVVPGSFNLLYSRWRGDTDRQPSQLTPDTLEFGVGRVRADPWISLPAVEFQQVWNWLQHDLAYDVHIATKPHEKALFSLLRSCSSGREGPDLILAISQALEALMECGTSQIKRTLKTRLAATLGDGPELSRWCDEFYRLRSKIIHGEWPIIRPGAVREWERPEVESYLVEFFRPEEDALAVLLALIRILVLRGDRQFAFS